MSGLVGLNEISRAYLENGFHRHFKQRLEMRCLYIPLLSAMRQFLSG
jgi:hypothetical protein